MMTFTMAHSYEGDWKVSIDLLHAAYKLFDKNMSRRYKKIGCVGKLKSLEAPVGVHGIHGHFHVLLTHILGADLSAFEALARAEWEKAVAHVGGACNDHGFDLKLNAMADYLAKQELAHEMSNHDTKKARRKGLLLGQLLDRSAGGDSNRLLKYSPPSLPQLTRCPDNRGTPPTRQTSQTCAELIPSPRAYSPCATSMISFPPITPCA